MRVFSSVRPSVKDNDCGVGGRYQAHIKSHLDKARTIQDDNTLHAGVNVLHFAFRGVCGQVSFRRCLTTQPLPAPLKPSTDSSPQQLPSLANRVQ